MEVHDSHWKEIAKGLMGGASLGVFYGGLLAVNLVEGQLFNKDHLYRKAAFKAFTGSIVAGVVLGLYMTDWKITKQDAGTWSEHLKQQKDKSEKEVLR